MLRTTLLYIIKGDEVMLAMKKRGFGVNKINGVGGKFSPETDRTIEDTCIRECEEECGVRPIKVTKRGVIDFYYRNKPSWDNRCAIYTAMEWTGELVETEEMSPGWYKINAIPFDRMWPDDKIWLPKVLMGKDVYYKFWFTESGEIIDYKEVSPDELCDDQPNSTT